MSAQPRGLLGLGVVAFVGTLACKPQYPYIACKDVPNASVVVEAVPLRAGDTLVVTVPRMEELSSTDPFIVTADGVIVIPIVGSIEVAGLTVSEAARTINARLNGIIVNPAANVAVVNQRLPYVSVIGEVRTPGRYPMEHEEGVMAALASAGGLTEFADPQSIYLVRKYPTQVRVRFDYYELTGGVSCPTSLVLRDGDVIVVE